MAESRTCPTCAAGNPEQARFCMACGGALEARCSNCGATAPPAAKFCMECGAGLAPGAPGAEAPAPAPSRQPPEERRQATVLFADLSGYTAATENMDPEAAKALVDRTLRRLGAEIERHGGSIDKYIGDNVMGVFGAPVAHEDDPERAVRAGLAMQDAMEEINRANATGLDFSLRVGINGGEVMAGAVGGDRYTVIGDVVNVASRLQDAGRRGSVTVGAATVRATAAAIAYEELEPLMLKGKEQPVPAWEATGTLTSGPSRRTALRAETPLIGRDEEAELLASLATRAESEGAPHMVTVVGQAGVGKSRLLRELVDRLAGAGDPPTIHRGQCPPYGSGIAYWALAEVLREEFEILDGDAPAAAWDKLRHGVEELMREAGDPDAGERNAALIARPLGIEPPEEAPAAERDDPQRMREALFSAIRACIEALAARRTLVLAFEDIHWADEGMLDLIEYLARWVRAPLLIVCMARDELLERRPGWGGGRRNATTVSLEPLTAAETEELVGALFPDGQGGMVGEVAERAGGNPLFAEEMVNRLIEEGSGSADDLPGTVQSLLAARLDSLARTERLLLQHASVIGQTFWVGSLEQTAAEEGIDLMEILDSLQEKDMLVPSAGSRLAGEREYAFKHVLIRDVAYGMLPKSVRCRKHEQVAGFIEERAGDRVDAVVGLVAEHYARATALAEDGGLSGADLARLRNDASSRLEAAGDADASLYSNDEALKRYTQALALAKAGGDQDGATRARIGEKQGDVALRIGRVDPAVEVWIECLEHHRGEENLERVGDLHRKIGAGLWTKGERQAAIDHYQKGIDLLKDGPPCLELVRLYEEAASLYLHTGDNMLAIYASEKALRLAERLGEARAASRAHGIFGRVFGRIGDADKARENLERSVELARESDRGEAVRALLTLGYHLEVSEAEYEGATEAYREALALAIELGDLPSEVELHAALAQLAVQRGAWEEAESATSASTALAEREGLTGKLCFPLVIRGALHWRAGEWEEAADACRRAHDLGEQVGRSEIAYTALFWLAAALRDGGDPAAAEAELVRALDLCERAGLIPQSLEATAGRAVALALAGRGEAAREAAESAAGLVERLHLPIADAAIAEAQGAADPDPVAGAGALADASAAWRALGREVDSARCLGLRAVRLAESGSVDAAAARSEADERAEELGLRGHKLTVQ